jgi:hypothetical protein
MILTDVVTPSLCNSTRQKLEKPNHRVKFCELIQRKGHDQLSMSPNLFLWYIEISPFSLTDSSSMLHMEKHLIGG